MTKTKILVLDIERQSGIVEGIWQRKQTGYLSTSQFLVQPRTICLAWKWLGDDEVQFSAEWDAGERVDRETYPGHKLMIEKAHSLLHEADFVVGWNSKPFDIPNLYGHMAEYNMRPPSPHIDVDLIKTSRSRFGFLSHRLADVAERLDMAGKHDTGYGLWNKLRWAEGAELLKARALMEEYNKRDVEQTEEMFTALLPWVPGLNLYGEGDYDPKLPDAESRCRRCNSTDIRWEGTRRARTWWYRRFVCKTCGGWGQGGRNYFSMETSSV